MIQLSYKNFFYLFFCILFVQNYFYSKISETFYLEKQNNLTKNIHYYHNQINNKKNNLNPINLIEHFFVLLVKSLNSKIYSYLYEIENLNKIKDNQFKVEVTKKINEIKKLDKDDLEKIDKSINELNQWILGQMNVQNNGSKLSKQIFKNSEKKIATTINKILQDFSEIKTNSLLTFKLDFLGVAKQILTPAQIITFILVYKNFKQFLNAFGLKEEEIIQESKDADKIKLDKFKQALENKDSISRNIKNQSLESILKSYDLKELDLDIFFTVYHDLKTLVDELSMKHNNPLDLINIFHDLQETPIRELNIQQEEQYLILKKEKAMESIEVKNPTFLQQYGQIIGWTGGGLTILILSIVMFVKTSSSKERISAVMIYNQIAKNEKKIAILDHISRQAYTA